MTHGAPLGRASVTITPLGDEHTSNVCSDQAQIHAGNRDWTIQLLGEPRHWRFLAKLIEDAAMEAERLAYTVDHYAALAEQVAGERDRAQGLAEDFRQDGAA